MHSAAMDNKQSAKLREQIETEMKMQNQWLQEMDLSAQLRRLAAVVRSVLYVVTL